MTTNEELIERYPRKAVPEMVGAAGWTLSDLQPQQLQTVNGGMSRAEYQEFWEGLLQM